MSSTTFMRALLLSALLAASGCQTGGSKPIAGAETSTQAMVCDKCHTAWVQQLDDKGHPVPFAYRSRGAESCPECDRIAAQDFSTGKMDACKMCGVTPQVVERKKL